MHGRTVLLAVALAIALPAAASGAGPPADRYTGDWLIDPQPGNTPAPWADGQQSMRIRASSESEVRGFAATLPASDQSRFQGACFGGSGDSKPPAIAYYAMTFTWSGGGTNMGCRSRHANGDLVVYGRAGQNGDFRFYKDTNGATRFGGDWGSLLLVAWRAEDGSTGCRSTSFTRSVVAKAAAVNEVRVTACGEGCEYRRSAGGSWEKIFRNAVLQQGYELSCDPEGKVTLAFSNNWMIDVYDQTSLKIDSFFTEGGVVSTELLLKNGRIAAAVNKSETTKSDLRVKTPTSVASVRGTTFTVFADAAAKAAIFSVNEGVVDVTAGGRTVSVTAGKEVETVGKTISKPVAIGLAGARGGINRASARDLVLAIVAATKCKTTVPRGKAPVARPGKNGWAVAVPLTGKVRGTARWNVTKGKPRAANALARRVTRNCR